MVASRITTLIGRARWPTCVCISCVLVLTAGSGFCDCDVFIVELDTRAWQGQEARLSLEHVITTIDSRETFVQIYDFAYDGRLKDVKTCGHVYGEIIERWNPASNSDLGDSLFLNGIGPVFDSLGTYIEFQCILGSYLDAADMPHRPMFACYLLGKGGESLVATEDPLGTSALFAITLTGDDVCSLEVFDPVELFPGGLGRDDTLRLLSTGTGLVEDDEIDEGSSAAFALNARMRGETVSLEFAIDNSAARRSMQIFDVSGRLVDNLPIERTARKGTFEWPFSERSSGRQPASGVYFVRLTVGDRSIDRKFILIR